MNYILTIIIFFLIQINFVQAESIKFYNFECSGVLRSNNITSIAKWKINFINANRATLDLYYDNKKKKWATKDQILVNSGCFTTGIRDGVDQWFDRRNKLKTSKPGTWTVTFDAYKQHINQHG